MRSFISTRLKRAEASLSPPVDVAKAMIEARHKSPVNYNTAQLRELARGKNWINRFARSLLRVGHHASDGPLLEFGPKSKKE